MVDISIIIVSWNVKDLLADCIRSIQTTLTVTNHSLIEIIVVDNLSSDGTPEMLRRAFPEVKVIEPGENTGFARGNNIGIQTSQGRYLYLLNPDTLILENSTQNLMRYLDEHPDVGVVGPRLLNADRTTQSSRRRFPTKWTAFFESTWLQPIAPPNIISHFTMSDIDDTEEHEVDWLQGAALMIRRVVVDAVGLLDETFFMYSEEIDWQRRILDAGWKVVYLPNAEVIHYGGKSSEQIIAQQHIYFQTSKILYYKKYFGLSFASFLRHFLLLNYRVQWIIEGIKALLGHKKELRRERMSAYQKVIRSGLRGERA